MANDGNEAYDHVEFSFKSLKLTTVFHSQCVNEYYNGFETECIERTYECKFEVELPMTNLHKEKIKFEIDDANPNDQGDCSNRLNNYITMNQNTIVTLDISQYINTEDYYLINLGIIKLPDGWLRIDERCMKPSTLTTTISGFYNVSFEKKTAFENQEQVDIEFCRPSTVKQ